METSDILIDKKKNCAWVYTLNNPTEKDYLSFFNRSKDEYISGQISYEVRGREHFEPLIPGSPVNQLFVTDKSQYKRTAHYQGCIVFPVPTSFKEVKQLLPRAHIEIMKKPLLAAVRYCTKDQDSTSLSVDQYGSFESTALLLGSVSFTRD